MSPSETLLKELRAGKPAAPPALRRRVQEIAAREPEREPFLRRLSLRRFVLVATPATVVAALLAGAVVGLTRPDAGDDQVAVGGATAARDLPATATLESGANEAAPAQEDATVSPAPGALPPTQGRLQRYDAQLQLRVEGVDELSAATQQAMRIARSLGGNVASVSYDAPSEGVGSAQLTLRVPVERVQRAIVQLSGLGTILSQRYGIEDLQPAADELSRQIAETQGRIAQIREQLRNPNRTASARAILQARLAEAQRQLADLRAALTGTREEARLATIQLGLTTEAILAAAEEEPGALDRIVDILRWEGIALLYVAVIAGPFVLLAVGLWLAFRLRRRREEARLLTQS